MLAAAVHACPRYNAGTHIVNTPLAKITTMKSAVYELEFRLGKNLAVEFTASLGGDLGFIAVEGDTDFTMVKRAHEWIRERRLWGDLLRVVPTSLRGSLETINRGGKEITITIPLTGSRDWDEEGSVATIRRTISCW
jgi:hypothetical protein